MPSDLLKAVADNPPCPECGGLRVRGQITPREGDGPAAHGYICFACMSYTEVAN